MINIKLTIPGQKQNISISQFTGNNNNEINGCKFWINTEIKNRMYGLFLKILKQTMSQQL
ncbi:hypothetical protein CM15mP35_05590 [bacterium]|nr:MAG: hypothetical protein CM15mP35_05590 [bacterium]